MNEELRLKCLELARADCVADAMPASATIDRARAYADFVIGRNDADVLRAAHQVMGAATALMRAMNRDQPQYAAGAPVTMKTVSS